MMVFKGRLLLRRFSRQPFLHLRRVSVDSLAVMRHLRYMEP
jgi:hypothetical protein